MCLDFDFVVIYLLFSTCWLSICSFPHAGYGGETATRRTVATTTGREDSDEEDGGDEEDGDDDDRTSDCDEEAPVDNSCGGDGQ